MTIVHILVFTLAALLIGRFFPPRWRTWALLLGSVLGIYWLQPSTPVRWLDFWFPTVSIGLTVLVWAITSPPDAIRRRAAALTAVVLAAALLAVALTRYLGPLCCLTPTPPPGPWPAALALAGLAVLLGGIYSLRRSQTLWGGLLPAAAILLILVLFLVLKSDPLGRSASAGLRLAGGQSPALASALDLRWLGFSYLAFRLLHALRDFQAGKLPAYGLDEFVTYALFFPTYTAGPIDRSQRFTGDLRRLCQPETARAPGELALGGWRILLGVFKKFAIADSLALFALNAQNAPQAGSTLWTWILLYAYALRLYFDFSGYTDIALGLGRLLGFNLPENFTAPYLKTNLTAFWNSWHITLAQWFRAYFFNPFTRFLRSGRKLPTWAVILLGQLSTMLLIGLWHGIALNFALWGLWHGVGLFAHNRWSDWSRPRLAGLETRPRLQTALALGGWLLTFNYVAFGWVWFALPEPGQALQVFRRLFGIG
jgi:D-alanyl-lipoteichoic acid acyltransferase DltB (MBOAT superfamily)